MKKINTTNKLLARTDEEEEEEEEEGKRGLREERGEGKRGGKGGDGEGERKYKISVPGMKEVTLLQILQTSKE